MDGSLKVRGRPEVGKSLERVERWSKSPSVTEWRRSISQLPKDYGGLTLRLKRVTLQTRVRSIRNILTFIWHHDMSILCAQIFRKQRPVSYVSNFSENNDQDLIYLIFPKTTTRPHWNISKYCNKCSHRVQDLSVGFYLKTLCKKIFLIQKGTLSTS